MFEKFLDGESMNMCFGIGQNVYWFLFYMSLSLLVFRGVGLFILHHVFS